MLRTTRIHIIVQINSGTPKTHHKTVLSQVILFPASNVLIDRHVQLHGRCKRG